MKARIPRTGNVELAPRPLAERPFQPLSGSASVLEPGAPSERLADHQHTFGVLEGGKGHVFRRFDGGTPPVQRMTFAQQDDPARLANDNTARTNWANQTACWPKNRTMAEWIARVPTDSNAKRQWDRFVNRNSRRNLEVAVASLKTHIEATYEAALDTDELAEKDRLIDELIRAIEPEKLDAWNPEAYADALIDKVNTNPRYLQSIKGKDPYVESMQDDEVGPNSLSAQRIKARVQILRPKSSFYTPLTPGGEDLAWEDWRKDDCVFAAILKVVLTDGAPTEEGKDEEMATTLAGHFNVAKGPVADPVILFLMEGLGWPHTGYANWATFQLQATQGSTYVLSLDESFSGTKSHVVVATYGTSWTIYDRQGNRLGQAISEPSWPNNPLDAWEVAETEAVQEVRRLF